MIKNKKFTTGSWIQCSNSNSIELISNNEFDWNCIDFEHGSFDFSNIQDAIRAIKLNKKICYVRTLSKNINEISKLMDMGIDGVFIPKIENLEEVKKIYKFIFYSPKGNRGVGYSRANKYGNEFVSYTKKSRTNVFIGMIESIKGVENLQSILEAKLLSGIFIGPYDLSSSMGMAGDFKSKKFKDSVKYILRTAKKYKIPCGIHILNKDKKQIRKIKKAGFSFMAYLTDSMVISNYKPL